MILRSFVLIALMNFMLPTVEAALNSVGIDADKLLRAAELIRNPQEDYEVKVGLEDVKGGKKAQHTYQTLVKGRTKSLVRFLTPQEDKGTKVLMVEDQMWVFVPSAAKPIRIAPRQRLTGNAAYGDIVRLSFVDNYTAKFLREDSYNKRRALVLELNSVPKKPVTYDKIEYWIDAANQRPLKALYQTSSGKTLKESQFEEFKDVFGVNRPSKFILIDNLQKDHVTTLVFSDAQKKSFSDLLFEKQNFGRQ